MSILYKLNAEKNGVEIKFTEKPSEEIRAKLKALGFRWSNYNGVWYAKQSEETIAFAKELAESEGEQISLGIEEPIEVSAESLKAERKAKYEQKVKAINEVKATKEPTKSTTDLKKSSKANKTTSKATKSSSKAENKVEVKAEKKEAAKGKDNIVIFPKARPEVKVAITEGSATYEECKAKLEAERKVFCDSDSQFVIDGLLKMCEVNPNFRNNVMREGKSYQGAFMYFMEMAKKGYALQYNGVTYLDNNIALGFAMDYFNEADVPTTIINGNIKAN